MVFLAWGEKILSWFKIKTDSYLETALLSLGLGLGVFAFYIYAIGVGGLLYRPALWLLVLLLSIWLVGDIRFNLSKVYGLLRKYLRYQKLRELDVFSGLLLILFFLHLAANLIGALAPEVVFDALWYHLALPKIYLANHKVFFVPHITLSGYPRLMEMLFTLGLGLKGEALAKLIHFSMGGLTAAGIFLIGRKFFSSKLALWAAAIFYAMQPINMLSATAYIDLGLAFFGLLALLALLNSLSSQQHGWLALSGCFIGLAMGTKYQGGLIALALIFSWVVFTSYSKNFSFGSKVGELLVFSLAAFLIFLPWALDNLWRTGNPVYPIFNKFFGLEESWEQVDIASHRAGGWFEGHNFLGFITLPWKLTMGSCDGWVSPLLLFFVPLSLFIARRRDWVFSFLLLFSFSLYALLFLLPYWIVRFFVPLLPALSILAAYSWQELGNLDKFVDKILKGVVVLVVLANLGFLLFKSAPLLPTSLGLESRESYLSRTLGWYSVNKYINNNISPGNKVLVYGAQLFYHFDFDYLYELPVKESAPDIVAAELKEKGISYILLLVDRTGPQNLWEIKGFENVKGSPYFNLVVQKDMPVPARTNAARGAKLYAVGI